MRRGGKKACFGRCQEGGIPDGVVSRASRSKQTSGRLHFGQCVSSTLDDPCPGMPALSTCISLVAETGPIKLSRILRNLC